MQECTRAVGLLVSESCPAHELVIQQHLGKLLTYLRKQMSASTWTCKPFPPMATKQLQHT
jgi:hypothetical protein